MKNWYKELKTRFCSFPSEIQILNLVSDLQKAKNLHPTNPDNAINHLYRAIILLDYIVSDPKWRNKLKELLRLREAIGSLICGDIQYGTISDIVNAALLMNCKADNKLKQS